MYLKLGNKKKSGFTLLLASLIAGLLLVIGLGIANILIKEISLRTSAKESNEAFYWADSGIECALYWDYNNFAFAANDSSPSFPPGPHCLNQDLTFSAEWDVDDTPTSATTIFSITSATSDGCAIVTVRKNGVSTTTSSRGYNDCDTSNPRRVERGIIVSY